MGFCSALHLGLEEGALGPIQLLPSWVVVGHLLGQGRPVFPTPDELHHSAASWSLGISGDFTYPPRQVPPSLL